MLARSNSCNVLLLSQIICYQTAISFLMLFNRVVSLRQGSIGAREGVLHYMFVQVDFPMGVTITCLSFHFRKMDGRAFLKSTVACCC